MPIVDTPLRPSSRGSSGTRGPLYLLLKTQAMTATHFPFTSQSSEKEGKIILLNLLRAGKRSVRAAGCAAAQSWERPAGRRANRVNASWLGDCLGGGCRTAGRRDAVAEHPRCCGPLRTPPLLPRCRAPWAPALKLGRRG